MDQDVKGLPIDEQRITMIRITDGVQANLPITDKDNAGIPIPLKSEHFGVLGNDHLKGKFLLHDLFLIASNLPDSFQGLSGSPPGGVASFPIIPL